MALFLIDILLFKQRDVQNMQRTIAVEVELNITKHTSFMYRAGYDNGLQMARCHLKNSLFDFSFLLP